MSVEVSGVVVGETLVADGTVNTLNETFPTTLTPCMYETRMMSYYPEVIKAITEFKAIIRSECPEFELMDVERENLLDNAYLLTMEEDRIEQWEHALGITPLPDSTTQDRRDTVVARIRGQGKLNTALINAIVNAFTGGTANSWVANSTLYVEITPPPNNKAYRFENVEQELSKKVPAHLNFQVSRNYYEWGQVKSNFNTWQDVLDIGTWEDVYLFVPFVQGG